MANPRRRYPPLGISQDLAAGTFRSGISAFDQRRWLRTSRVWSDLKPRTWRPTKVLGAGTSGICGLWQYVGRDPAYNGPDYLVVKQVTPAGRDEFEFESLIMERIMASSGGTDHVVKLYKAIHHSPGANTSELDPSALDPVTGDFDDALCVSRIYIEYCPGGDLDHTAICLPAPQARWQEEILWRIFHCLAKALLVLDRGSENLNQPRWASSVAHFDLKPQNIFIGARDAGEHQRLEAFKIGDFGLAMPLPSNVGTNAREWVTQVQWRGTPDFLCPEQIYADYPHTSIGKETNTWNIGNIMHRLIRHQGKGDTGVQKAVWDFAAQRWTFQADAHDVTTPTVASTNGKQFRTFGHNLLDPESAGFYSKQLIELVFACMAYTDSDRPTARQILTETQRVITSYDNMNAALPLPNTPLVIGEGGMANILCPIIRLYTPAELAAIQPPVALPLGNLFQVPVQNWPIPPNPPGAPQANLLFPVAGAPNVIRNRPPR